VKRRNLRLTRHHIRNVTGTLRSQERPKLKSSLFSLSIQKLVVAESTETEEVRVRRVSHSRATRMGVVQSRVKLLNPTNHITISYCVPTRTQRQFLLGYSDTTTIYILRLDTTLSSAYVRLRPSIANKASTSIHDKAVLTYFLMRMDSISMNPVVSVGSKPPNSSMDDSFSSYRPWTNTSVTQEMDSNHQQPTSSEERPSTTTLPLYSFSRTTPFTVRWLAGMALVTNSRSGVKK
jgi:hypothetical protein